MVREMTDYGMAISLPSGRDVIDDKYFNYVLTETFSLSGHKKIVTNKNRPIIFGVRKNGCLSVWREIVSGDAITYDIIGYGFDGGINALVEVYKPIDRSAESSEGINVYSSSGNLAFSSKNILCNSGDVFSVKAGAKVSSDDYRSEAFNSYYMNSLSSQGASKDPNNSTLWHVTDNIGRSFRCDLSSWVFPSVQSSSNGVLILMQSSNIIIGNGIHRNPWGDYREPLTLYTLMWGLNSSGALQCKANKSMCGILSSLSTLGGDDLYHDWMTHITSLSATIQELWHYG